MPKIVRFYQTGAAEVLKLEQVELAEPGPDELLVTIEAIGLNRAEVMFREGKYLEAAELPAQIGYEAAAIVEKSGSTQCAFKPGDKVCVIPAFSMNDYGIYAEQAIVPIHAVIKRPDGLSASESAAVWMPYLTAWGGLVDLGKLCQNQVVLITAASSSVGLAAIQIANHLGAIPIAITRHTAKKQALLAHGAKHVIMTESENLVEQVMHLTDNQGADRVFDPVAGSQLADLAAACKPYAQLFIYGALSPEQTPFPLFPTLAKGLTLRGYTLFEFIRDTPRLLAAINFIEKGIQQGHLRPVISKTFALEDIVAAHQYLESNHQIGKVIVIPSAFL